MIAIQEFLIRVRIDRERVETWVSSGWLVPQREPELLFSDVDIARAQLIRDLSDDLGVNDEGISVILHLLDQMHGLRRSMRDLLDEVRREREARTGGHG